MSRFNLLDEEWICVLSDEKHTGKEVSLIDFFKNAHLYSCLAGDTKTQDFAVMRFLLAVLHTVFSRFNADGEEYGYFELDEKFRQTEQIGEDDEERYANDLMDTWKALWKRGSFPEIVVQYLEKWADRFYLFDEKYPFYQVTKEDISPEKLSSNPTKTSGKYINRLISQSGNKTALFSPKYGANSNKDKLTESEIARWLLAFHAYTGQADKASFGNVDYNKKSIGWLYNLGGIYFEGNNLYETLLLNLVLSHPELKYVKYPQSPCWEFSSSENIAKLLKQTNVYNISELYTNWSRAIYIDPEFNTSKPFSFEIVKLPDIMNENQFLEPMTLWKYNDSGDNKGSFTPRKHRANTSVWRSFGLITLSYDSSKEKGNGNPQKRPVIIDWLSMVSKIIGDYSITLNSVSMQDDGRPSARLITDEIYDKLNINEMLLTDFDIKGWVTRLNETIDETKYIVDVIYRKFVKDIKDIRNLSSDDFVNRSIQSLYFRIDKPFRDWIEGIKPTDTKDEKILEWRDTLRKLVLLHINEFMKNSNPRDFTGTIIKNKKSGNEYTLNIAIAFNSFMQKFNNKLPKKEV